MILFALILYSVSSKSLQPRYASIYGDPHFHIKAKNEYQPDLCFDYLNKRSDMDRQHLLLRDDETGFTVRGQTFKPFALSDQLYFRDLWLTSSHNITLHVTSNGISVAAYGAFGQRHRVEPSIKFDPAATWFGDVIIGSTRKTGSSGQFSVNLSFINGPSLTVTTGKNRNVNFSIEDGYLSQNLTGLLGPFLKENGYRVVQSEEDPYKGWFFANGAEAEVIYKRHNHDKNCWTLADSDMRQFLHGLSNEK